jgi:magnesium transporter
MIIAYIPSDIEGMKRVELNAGDTIPKNAIWIDLLEPSGEEEKLVEKAFSIDAPTREEMDKIELISPFYKEDDAYYVTITVIHKMDKDCPEGTAITFILLSDCLITLRYARPKAFSYFSARLMRTSTKKNLSPDIVFEGLIESMVTGVADVLEKTGNELDQLLIDVFEKPKDINNNNTNNTKKTKRSGQRNQHVANTSMTGNYYTNIIKRVGRSGNLVSKIRESLVSISRMLIFIGQIEAFQYIARKETRIKLKNLSREIHSLTEYANFLAQRNSFLLDATLGMINVEQNMIIKVFTVAAAVFLPPTLIASIYGMNFDFMPELSWVFGYPFALLLIILSALLPYYIFKKKGWL